MPSLIKNDMRSRVARRPVRGARLNREDYLFILWCFNLGLTINATSKLVVCNSRVVLDYRKKLFGEPNIIFELPLMVKQGVKKYLCRFCGSMELTEIACKRHILRHIMPREYAEQLSLKPKDW